MGVFKRGRIWYIRYREPDGQLTKESTGQETKRLAEQILRKRKTAIAEGKHLDKVDQPRMTMTELCDWYWQHHAQHKKSHGITGVLNRIKVFFKATPITAVTPEAVSEFFRQRLAKDRVTTRTANRDLQELKSMFNRVIHYKCWRRVLENPVTYVKLAKESNERVRYLTTDEITRLVHSASEHLRPVIVTALHTGMRRGEILNLQWQDVNLTERVVQVTESKNGEGRHLPISDELYNTLLQLPSRFRGGYVFPSYLPRRTGTVKSPAPFTDIKNSFRAALDKAGISDFRFHDLRHTFASHLVMNGADLNTVRELLGHKSLRMTLRYAHLSHKHKDRVIRLIDNALGGTSGTAGVPRSDPARIIAFPGKR